VTEIEEGNRFQNIKVFTYPWSQVSTTEEYIGFLKTGNGYLTLDQSKRELLEDKVRQIIEKHGGTIERRYQCTLFMAQKVDSYEHQ